MRERLGNQLISKKKKAKGLFSLAFTAILLILMAGGFVSAETITLPNEAPIKAGELLVQIDPSAKIQNVTDFFSNRNMRPVRELSRRLNIWLVSYDYQGLKAGDHRSVLEGVRNHAGVEVAQFNHEIKPRATTPNDPQFSNQWALNNTGQTGGVADADIDAPEAWDLATGGTSATGEEIIVAVVDGGFDLNHEDIAYWKNEAEIPSNGVDDDGNGYVDDYDGWNAYNSTGNIPSDTHGTHVAGIAGATGNNGTGISGVNWGVKIMPIAGSTGSESIAVAAYGYIHEMRSLYNETDGASGALIVSTNSSFGVDYGDPDDYPLWCGMYDSLGVIGILSAAATANIGINIDVTGDVPTACGSDYLISVTNTTDDDIRNSGAAYGPTTIDLGAPGTSIRSTIPGSSYGNLSGTSMATPHVAGAVAFMYAVGCESFMMDYKSDPGGVALLVKDNILNGVDPLASLSGTTVSGGRLNLYNSAILTAAYPCGITITHTPLENTNNSLDDYHVVAEITSPANLLPDSLRVIYEINSVSYEVLMYSTGNPDEFEGFIPAQSPGTNIDYYITASDDDGNNAQSTMFSFRIIDYGVAFTADSSTAFGQSGGYAWHDVTITNIGAYDEDYNLYVSGNTWPLTIWDETGTYQIGSTGSIGSNGTFSFKIRAEVDPGALYGDDDRADLTAEPTDAPVEAATIELKSVALGPTGTFPWEDDFAGPNLDPVKWAENIGASLESNVPNPPSPPYALFLDGGKDTVTSQLIDLGSAGGAVMSYYFEQGGYGTNPGVGDDLTLQYRNDLDQWVTLNVHPGGGAVMYNFEFVEIPLPVDAIHDLFQVRFISYGSNEGNDHWYVDNVRIDYTPVISASPMMISELVGQEDSTTAQLLIENTGLGQLNYNIDIYPLLNRSTELFSQLAEAGLVEPATREYDAASIVIEDAKGVEISGTGVEVTRDAGGPDNFGNYWIDSDQEGGPVFNWIDISATGTDISAMFDDDNHTDMIPLDFDFPFYGQFYNEICIGSNGIIGFDTTDMKDQTNLSLPSVSIPNGFLAWFWDDLDITNYTNTDGRIYMQFSADMAIIQFKDFPEYSAGVGDVINAEVILYPDGTVIYQYLDIAPGFDIAGATIGMENMIGNDGLEINFNSAYIHDSMAIAIYQPSAWLTLESRSGSVLPGGSTIIEMKFNSTGMDLGTYQNNLIIYSNDSDPSRNPMTIPVEMTVTDQQVYTCGDVNDDDAVDILDILYFIEYKFKEGPAPLSTWAADVNHDGNVDVLDILYLIDFKFKEGPAPDCQ